MRKVLLAGCITAGGLFVLAAPAGAQPAPIAVDQIVRGDPGSVHLVGTDTVDPEDVGLACDVTVTGGNNQSIHPNTDILIDSGTDQAVAPDVERDADGIIDTAGTLVLGDTITVSVRLGADGVFSGGFTVVFACPTATTTTTVTVAPTTIAPQNTTTTGETNATVLGEDITSPGSTSGSGSLPNTGFSPVIPAVVGCLTLAAGVALLAEARRRRTPNMD